MICLSWTYKIVSYKEFSKSRTMLACVPTSSACQSASMTAWFTCQHACMPAWFMCQHACMLMYQKHANFSFLCANVQIKVPTCHTTCHFFFNLVFQQDKWCASFSTWHANVPKDMPSFQIVLLQNAKGNFYTLLLYKKLYILLDIIVKYICIC